MDNRTGDETITVTATRHTPAPGIDFSRGNADADTLATLLVPPYASAKEGLAAAQDFSSGRYLSGVGHTVLAVGGVMPGESTLAGVGAEAEAVATTGGRAVAAAQRGEQEASAAGHMAQGADSAVNAEHKAAETALPDGYRVLDDSVGAKRVDPPDGYRWVANSDGEAKLQSLSDGKIYESRKEVPENSSADSGNSEGAGGVKEAAKVTAETEIGGQKISGINQTARDPSVSDPNKPTLIGDKIQAKIDATGKPLPNGNMSTAHAEIEVIQKAFDAGLTKGHDMTIKVTGQPVCSYCRSDIRAMADKAGLNKIEIYETTTGKTLVSIRQPNGSMSKMSEK